MISDVFLTARVGSLKKGIYRFIELEREVPVDNKYVTDLIPVTDWTKGINTTLMKLKDGAAISLRGRLEVDNELGMVIIAEEYLTLSSNPNIIIKKEEG